MTASVSYERRRSITHKSIERLREMGDHEMCGMDDRKLGNLLDSAVADAIAEKKVEDIVEAGQPGKLVDISELMQFELYAIVRADRIRNALFDEVVITVLQPFGGGLARERALESAGTAGQAVRVQAVRRRTRICALGDQSRAQPPAAAPNFLAPPLRAPADPVQHSDVASAEAWLVEIAGATWADSKIDHAEPSDVGAFIQAAVDRGIPPDLIRAYKRPRSRSAPSSRSADAHAPAPPGARQRRLRDGSAQRQERVHRIQSRDVSRWQAGHLPDGLVREDVGIERRFFSRKRRRRDVVVRRR